MNINQRLHMLALAAAASAYWPAIAILAVRHNQDGPLFVFRWSRPGTIIDSMGRSLDDVRKAVGEPKSEVVIDKPRVRATPVVTDRRTQASLF